MTKVFKKPGLLARAFGTDKEGRNGLSVFLSNWTSASYNRITDTKGGQEMNYLLMNTMLSVFGGAAIYGLSQWAEHGLVNQRPNIPQDQYIQTLDDNQISMMTVINDHDYEVSSFSNYNGEKNYLLIQDEDGSYEISTCSGSICTPLSGDDVLELRGEFRAMAVEDEVEYLNPGFFFPQKIESLTRPIDIQEIGGTFDDESFIVLGTPRRYVQGDNYSVDGQEQRLNSELMSFDTDGLSSLWRTALDSPENGTYSVQNSEDDLYIWQRTQSGEWQDLPTSENAGLTMLGTFMLLNSLVAMGQIAPARRRTQSDVKKLQGLNLLKR